MNLKIEYVDGDCVVVRIGGRLDAPAVDRLEAKFDAAVAAAGRNVLVDLGAVDFVASLGLRMFIMAVRATNRRGKQVVFFAANPAVAQVLEHAAFEKIAPLAADRAAALALVKHATH